MKNNIRQNTDTEPNLPKRSQVKILVCYHKKDKLFKNDILVPIHCGRALACEASKDGKMSEKDYQWMLDNMIGDDTGDNISELNREVNEMTAIYWAWKNYDKLGNPDYIGLCHYRRLFDFSQKFNTRGLTLTAQLGLTSYKLNKILKKYDFICTTGHAADKHNVFERHFVNLSESYHPLLYKYSQKYKKEQWFYTYNMFIMKKDDFFNYCEEIFPLMFDYLARDKDEINQKHLEWVKVNLPDFYEKVKEKSEKNNSWPPRFTSYMMEYISGFYFMYLLDKYKEKVYISPLLFNEDIKIWKKERQKKVMNTMLSIRNEYRNGKKYKIISVLGLKLKMKCRNKQKPSYTILIKYDKKTDRINIDAGAGYESKVTNSIYLFLLAFDRIRNQVNKSFDFEIHCTDYVMEHKNHIFASSNNGQNNVTMIPDGLFINWVEAGIPDYDKTCQEIESAGKLPPIYNECLWIGNVKTHISREELLNKFADNKNFKLIGMNWKGGGERGLAHDSDTYISLPDHTKYKYLLDIRGNGYSGRVKFLLFSNRPLFYIERDIVEFYNDDLKPFIHYIPVKADLSDLQEKYEWAEANPDKAKEIAANALEYAKTHLTREAAIQYYSKIILDWANK